METDVTDRATGPTFRAGPAPSGVPATGIAPAAPAGPMPGWRLPSDGTEWMFESPARVRRAARPAPATGPR